MVGDFQCEYLLLSCCWVTCEQQNNLQHELRSHDKRLMTTAMRLVAAKPSLGLFIVATILFAAANSHNRHL